MRVIKLLMKIVGRQILEAFKQKHADVRSQVDVWVAEVKDAQWETPNDIKARYASASFLPDKRVIFNLKGPKYRLAIQVSYKNKVVYVEKAGTHEEYMKW